MAKSVVVRGSSAPTKKQTPPAARDRFAEGPDLWGAVRLFCEGEFKRLTGRPWRPELRKQIRQIDRLTTVETEARDILRALEKSLQRAAKFANENPVTYGTLGQGRVTVLLWHWLRSVPLSLFDMDYKGGKFVRKKEKPNAKITGKGPHTKGTEQKKPRWPGILNARASLVHLLDTYDEFDLSGDANRDGPYLDVREFTLASLLVGNRPQLDPRLGVDGKLSISDVISAEEQAMRVTLSRHGVRWAGQEEGSDKPAPRGRRASTERR